jgi:cobalamin biosynthesis protein CobT
MSAYIAARVAAVIREHGEAMTLKRQLTADPQTFSTVALYGKRYRPAGQAAEQVVDDVGQARLDIIVSNDEIAAGSWAGPPRKGDILVIAGRDYELVADADTRKNGDAIVEHRLTVVG